MACYRNEVIDFSLVFRFLRIKFNLLNETLLFQIIYAYGGAKSSPLRMGYSEPSSLD